MIKYSDSHRYPNRNKKDSKISESKSNYMFKGLLNMIYYYVRNLRRQEM